jgi:hypothetical protein
MDASKPLSYFWRNEQRAALGVIWCSQKYGCLLLLQTACGAKTHYEFSERRMGVVDVRLLERDELVREVTRQELVRVTTSLEWTRFASKRSVATALRQASYSPSCRLSARRERGWEAKIRLCAVHTTEPEPRRRIHFANVSAPEKVFDRKSDL